MMPAANYSWEAASGGPSEPPFGGSRLLTRRRLLVVVGSYPHRFSRSALKFANICQSLSSTSEMNQTQSEIPGLEIDPASLTKE